MLLLGTKGKETGTAIALFETKSKKKYLDKISLNAFVGKNLESKEITAGLVVEKEIFSIKNIFGVGLGIGATKEVKKLFDKSSPNYSLALSTSYKF